MFTWLRNLFGTRNDGDMFRPKDMLLYGYWNGQVVVKQDPLVLYKRLMAIMPEMSVNIRHANMPVSGNIEASNSLVKQICSVFDVQAYDKESGKGLTEAALTALLGHFLRYCDTVKKNAPGFVKPALTSVPIVPPTESVPEDVPTTTTISDSILTNEPVSTDTPIIPSSESASPSDSSNPHLIILGPTQTEKETPS